jgi:hypothetical protein
LTRGCHATKLGLFEFSSRSCRAIGVDEALPARSDSGGSPVTDRSGSALDRRWPEATGVKRDAHAWAFKPRFRRHAFGWRSQPAIQRVREAVAEIKKVARRDPVLAGEGAVILIERLSPALERVDSSSGAMGAAVNGALAALVPIIAGAPIDAHAREAWLDRLWAAHERDQMPYIELLGDYWGELCGSREIAEAWGDRLAGITRMALSPDRDLRGHFHGTSACLSALYRAERYAEILQLLEVNTIWPYKRWAVRSLVALGEKAAALRYAEACRNAWTSDQAIDAVSEEILLSSGLAEEAYRRFGLTANRAGSYAATFRAVVKKYPHKSAKAILDDLVATTPGEEGKWFAAAKDAKLYEQALALAGRTPCDPRTLARAARDLADAEPAFALEAGVLALHWLAEGYGYEITGADVWAAYASAMKAAEHAGTGLETRRRIRALVATERVGQPFVAKILGRELGL